jgi:hypothetical protein
MVWRVEAFLPQGFLPIIAQSSINNSSIAYEIDR